MDLVKSVWIVERQQGVVKKILLKKKRMEEPMNEIPEKHEETSSSDPMSHAKDMMDDVKGMKNSKPGDFMPGKAKDIPKGLKVIQWLLVIGAVLSVLSAISFFGFSPWAGIAGLVNAALALVIVWGINKRAMWAYWLLIILIVWSVIYSLLRWQSTNILTLVIDGIMLYYVTQGKKWFVATK